jgi:hypothetical protein
MLLQDWLALGYYTGGMLFIAVFVTGVTACLGAC